MALFGAKNHRSSAEHEGRYSPVHELDDDEAKPLRSMHERHPESDQNSSDEHLITTRELYALSRSLRRTNLFLKIIIGLLVLTIITLLTMNVPDSLKKLIKSAACAPNRLLKSPVPPLALETRVFQKSPLYSQRPNKHSDTAWDGLLPVSLP
jgi:hypothetical protein